MGAAPTDLGVATEVRPPGGMAEVLRRISLEPAGEVPSPEAADRLPQVAETDSILVTDVTGVPLHV